MFLNPFPFLYLLMPGHRTSFSAPFCNAQLRVSFESISQSDHDIRALIGDLVIGPCFILLKRFLRLEDSLLVLNRHLDLSFGASSHT